MRAAAHALAERDGDRTVLRRIASRPPLVLRQTDGGLTLVTGAAGPLGGDETELTIEVGDAAALTVGSAGAALALPGHHGGTSTALVRLVVGADAVLCWRPEPLIVAAGADHIVRFEVELAESARLRMVETLVLGRHAEPPGRLRSQWRVRRAGRTLLAQDLDVGVGAPEGWDGPAVLGGARVLATALVVDPFEPPTLPDALPPAAAGTRVDVLALADPVAVLVVAAGPDTIRVGNALAVP